jgi:adenylate cyclase
MVESSRPSIQIDLNEFKLHLHLKGKSPLTLHFNSPSRSFYLSVIALVVNEMKKSGKIKTISLQEHLDLLALLNETVGGAAGSSEKEILLHRIYTKWKDALPNLEEAPLFKVQGKKKKEEGDGGIGKVYSFTDAEKDGWANLFDYLGSHENVRLKFAIDKIGVSLEETSIIFGDSRNGEAWDQFISNLKKGGEEKKKEETVPPEEIAAPQPPAVPFSAPELLKISWLSRYRWILLVVLISVVAVAIWEIYLRPARIEVASVERMNYPLPDQPSIAVLPFVNMSGDPKQDFLCDAMTEDIITALSRVPRLFVIARNSAFVYKGKPVKVKQVSEELGIRHVLEGSLQRSADRVRINVQLIDALTGQHLWAKRYERDLADIFALQDEITTKVLVSLEVLLTGGGEVSGAERFAEKYYRGKHGLDCYLKLAEAWGYFQRYNIEGMNLARQIAEEVIAMCPENPLGYLRLGWVYWFDYYLGNTKSPRETIEKSMGMAQTVLAINNYIGSAHGMLSNIYLVKREYDKAVAEAERALALSPGSQPVLANYSASLRATGRPEEAIPLLQKAIRRDPFGPASIYNEFGHVLRDAGRLEEALAAYKKAIQISPDHFAAHVGLVVTYIWMGRENEARAVAAEVLRINPKYSVDYTSKTMFYKDQSFNDRFVAALRKAGLK